MNRLLLFIALLLTGSALKAQNVTITESTGWLETAMVKWLPVENALSYNVYYSGEGNTNQKIDNFLIRQYPNYYRADILGLKAGNYTISVKAVFESGEGEATQTASIAVLPHDRTGFAFANGRMPGAYKADGTPKDNAVVLYVTENNKNTISLDVTGANANPCVGLQNILDGFKKGRDNRALIIRLIGQVKDFAYMLNGDIVIENANNALSYITLEGVGDDAVADGWGIRVKNASNIEIRNIATMNCNSGEGDNIGLQQDNDYVWVHHCDFFYGDAGSDADQAKGDGALDSKKSTYITFSYNHFWDTGKSNLVGLSEGTTQGLFITFHHNWYDHSDSRHPRVRYYSAHVYNNYYDGIAKYGVGSTLGSSVFVEGNYFRNCKYPMLTSMQGSDVFNETTQKNDYSTMPTFSKENGGTIKAFNNYMTGQRRFVAYGNTNFPNPTVDFDAYVASTRDEIIPSSVVSAYGGNTYNNFDTNSSVMYNYTPDSPEEAKQKVMLFAGRMQGGDFKWTFNNTVDDTSYDVNTALKNALVNYTTTLLAVQGDVPSGGGDNGGGGNNGGGEPNPGDMVHNFTLSGTNSTFYNITGNTSTTKGTVNYGGLTLTQCLKIESATTITFTTTQTATLTLVFNDNFTGAIKINAVNYNAIAGIVTVTLQAGSHTISKHDTANLYYMSLANEVTTSVGNNPRTVLRIFPNPVANQLNITGIQNIEYVEIYNIAGVLVKRANENKNSIDLSELSKGNYLLMVHTQNHVYKEKFVKK